MELPEVKVLFAQPPMDARPAPFWFWNDHLEAERLVEQFDRLLAAGAGGAVMHARGGLPPEEYLDERWFAAIGAVLHRASERDAIMWIYDELGWPSGTAGGRIPGTHPGMRMPHLKMTDLVAGQASLPCPLSEMLAVFHVTRSDTLHGFQRRHDGSASLFPDRIRYESIAHPLKESEWTGERLLVFHRVYLDNTPNYFDPQVTAEFVRVTHDEYYKRFGALFGTTIRRVFMDEPGVRGNVASLPWDHDFDAEFQARRGRSLLPELPALFFETPGHEAVRFAYWSLVAEKFREGFIMPINEWCQAHSVASSGHVDFEATLKEAVRQTGSPMPIYEHQGMVGIDILGSDFYSRRIEQEAYGYYLVTIKQAASVSRQLDKGGVVSESYGVGGHALSPEGMQIATNFQMALGVTFLCHHAPFYSIRGERKQDCPPFIDWREPYWPFFCKHFDTISRTGWLLKQGRAACEVLLMHPMASIQATYRLMRIPEERKAENYLLDADLPFEVVEKHFTLLSSALMDAQIDHDYGDEEILARHGKAIEGRLDVGVMSYRLVVLPPLTNIRASTLALLRTYVEMGGVLIVVGSAPHLVDGYWSNEAAEFIERHAIRIIDGVDRFDYGAAVAQLTRHQARTVRIEDHAGNDVSAIKAQRRMLPDAEILYVANISREAVSARCAFEPGVTGVQEEWDATSGHAWPIGRCVAGQAVSLDIEWAPGQARIFVFHSAPSATVEEAPPLLATMPEIARIRPEWKGNRTQPNVLLLDQCRLKHANAESSPLSIWQARDVLAELITKHGTQAIVTEYQFNVSADHPVVTPCDLALELCEGMRVTLNGQPVDLDVSGWVLDPAIRRIPLPSCRPGVNVLQVSAPYAHHQELQSPWILGAFRLTSEDFAEFVLEYDDASLEVGSWVSQGAPFYAGTVVYVARLDAPADLLHHQFILDMPGLLGTAQVRVNGARVDDILWPPYSCDITGFMKSGVNLVEVEVANTLRNLFGPHYEPNEANMPSPSDNSYRGLTGQPKRFLDYGLTRSPEIIILRSLPCANGSAC